MRLASFAVHNFRSYRDRVSVPASDFTAIMGRNDVGKSTLLEALDIFFNHQTIKLDGNDPCVHGSDRVIEISCEFEELPDQLTIDARSPTTLQGEHLLNSSGFLELVKRFDCKGSKPKEEVFARAHHPSNPQLADLLRLKNGELKARAREIGCDLSAVDERSNVALRGAIRQHVGDLGLAETLVPLNEDDGKKVWDQLEKRLPTFALFQADRPSKDDDPEVADPMKLAVAAAVREVESDLEQIKERVRTSAMEVARRTLAKLKEMDPQLANELVPSFRAEPKWDGFKLSLSGDDQIPINKRGSGVRRLILLSFFRAEAERRRAISETHRVIYAIEEPESSQHPDNQTLLVRTLLSLADDPRTQVLITTHVPSVAALVPTDAVRLVTRTADGVPMVQSGGADVYERVVESLGVTPDRRAQVAIFVEGPNDVEFLRHAARLYRTSDATLLDFDSDHRIAFVPTGGGNLKHWVNHRYLLNAGLVEVHIYDTDDATNPKYKAQVDLVNGRQGRDIAFLTQRREMENYIHPNAIAGEFGCQLNPADWDDVPMLVAEHVHAASGSPNPWDLLDKTTKEEKASKAKRRLNGAAMARMTLAELQEQDRAGEILGWLTAIRDRIR